MTRTIIQSLSLAAGGRRKFLFDAFGATLSGAAVAVLAGAPALARAGERDDSAAAADLRILNTALGAEREAVAAYGVGASSGLLTPPVLKVAASFKDHHAQHVDALVDAIRKLGGQPDEERALSFTDVALASEADVLRFAAGLERGAVSAYAGAIPLFEHRELSKAAASILADEAMHWAVLRHALALDPVPGAFFS